MQARNGRSVRARLAAGAAGAVVCAAAVGLVAGPGGADHLAPQIVETNDPAVVSETPGSVGTETACPGGWSGGSAQILGNVTAHLSWTFTVPADHTGVVSVFGYRDPGVARPFYFWVDADPMALVANPAGAQDCRASLASSASLPAGTHTVNVSGTDQASAYLDYFQLVTASITGDLVITKVTDTPGTFDFTVDCPDAGVVARPVQVDVAAAGPPGTAATPVTGLPVGTACTVTEATAPGFAPQAPQTVTVAEGTNGVTFTNVRQTGSLVVTKTTEGGTGTFGFAVDCEPGTTFDQTFTLAGGETRRIDGIPTLTTCRVTETPDSAYTSTSDPADGTVTIATGDNTVSFVNTVRPPVLALTKTADAATVSSGASVGFTVTASNTGAGPARSVVVSDPLPAAAGVSWSIAPAYAGPGTCAVTGAASSQRLDCSVGDLAAGASASVHVVSATTAATGATLSNTATASAANAAPVTASASVAVNRPALAVTKTADAPAVNAGGAVGFTVAVSNAGPGTATAVTLDDPLPAAGAAWSIAPAYAGPGTCAVSGTVPSQTLACSLGDLAPGASASVHVTSTTSAAAAAVLANTATARAANAGAVSATASVTVTVPAAVAPPAAGSAGGTISTASSGAATGVSGGTVTAAASTTATTAAAAASVASGGSTAGGSASGGSASGGSASGGSAAAGEGLARTGVDVATLAGAGLLLLLGGGALVRATRRRRA